MVEMTIVQSFPKNYAARSAPNMMGLGLELFLTRIKVADIDVYSAGIMTEWVSKRTDCHVQWISWASLARIEIC